MTEDPTSFTLDQLALSPLNVRYNEEDCGAVGTLAASIVEEGLLHGLTLHPAPKGADWANLAGQKKPAGYGVLAGGRRYRAIRLAIGDGRLPADFEIAAKVKHLSDAEIVLVSLEENLLRRNLRDYEVHAAISRAHGLGMNAAAIAAHSGQRLSWVEQQLRLGGLDPAIFAEYAEGRLSRDHAYAYAATEDRALQRSARAHFAAGHEWNHTPAAIRGFLKVGDRELERLLLFVGDAIYRSHGGRFELDLFTEGPDRGRVVDEELLRTLAEEKLAALKTRVRETIGARDLRFVARPPQFAGRDDIPLEIEPPKGGWEKIRLPSPEVVANLEIHPCGTGQVRFWWPSRKVKAAAEPSKRPSSSGASGKADKSSELTASQVIGNSGGQYEQQARAAVREEHGFSADGLQIVRSTRRMLLRSALMRDAGAGGNLGRDYLVWSLLRHEFTRDRDAAIGARALATEWNGRDAEPTGVTRNYLEGQPGEELWKHLLAAAAELEPFALTDAADAFAAYVVLCEEEKASCAALAAGLALLRSAAAPGWNIAVHDRLANLAGASDAQLRRFWKPEAVFLGLLPKLKRLELAQTHLAPDKTRALAKAKDKAISAASAAALAAQEDWIHPLLSFGVDASAAGRPPEPAVAVAQPAERQPEAAL